MEENQNLNIFIKSTNNVYNWVINENLSKFRYVYNDVKVKQYKDREIKKLNIELKTLKSPFNQKIKSSKLTKKKYKKRDLKNLSICRAFSIINRPEILEEEKKKRKDEIENKID